MEHDLTVLEKTAEQETVPTITQRVGNTTYVVGLHFKESSGETLEEKMKRLIKKDVANGNF